mgnify:CR=1 FL=1
MGRRIIKNICHRQRKEDNYLAKLSSALMVILFLISSSALAEDRPHVLLLHSYHSGLDWTDNITKGIVDELHPDTGDIKLDIEYMDTKKLPFDDNYQHQLYKLYQYKYSKTKFDLILVSDNNAFDFVRRHQNNLFAGVPIVFCGVNFFRDEQLEGYKNITGVAEVFDARSTVALARKLHPEIKKLFVINDYLPTGRAWEKEIKSQLESISEEIEITYSDNLTMDNLLGTINQLPDDTVVLLGAFFQDAAEQFYDPQASTKLITDNSDVPVYSLLDFNLGHGIVGGNLINGYSQGEAAAKLGKRILAGESADEIPVIKEGSNSNMFDKVQLRRFGINEKQLPAGSQTINKDLVTFSPQELAWIAAHPVIRLAPDPAFQPFEFFDSNGSFKGIAADYIALLEKKVGIHFDPVQLTDWLDVIKQVKTGEVDMVSAVMKTPDKDKYLNFTEPYLKFPYVIITRHDNSQQLDLNKLQGKSVAVVNKYAIHDFLKRDHDELNLVPVADYVEGLRGVAFGDYDAFVANLASLSYFIEKEGISNLHVAGESGYFINLSVAVRKDMPELISILNKSLRMTSNEERAEINSRWVKLDITPWWQMSRAQIAVLVSILGGLIVLAIVAWNYQLRRVVRVRTLQLSEVVERLDLALKEQALILSNAQIGIAYVVDRKLRWVNPKLAEQRGIYEDELVGQSTRVFYVNDEDYEEVGRVYSQLLAKGERYETEVLFRRGEEDTYWCRLVGQAVDPKDVNAGTIWLLQDVSAQKELENYLTTIATTDYLTGIYNRRHFSELANREIKRSSRYQHFLSVLMLDIDNFKLLNDKYGHAVGDLALKFFTETTQLMLREQDIFGRIGGEEFAIILPETEVKEAIIVAERICKKIAASGFDDNGTKVKFTVSIGLTCYRDGETDLDMLLADADKALYQAKESGRNKVVTLKDGK